MKYIIIALLLTGCATSNQTQKLSPQTYYRQDICFEYESQDEAKAENNRISNPNHVSDPEESAWGNPFGAYSRSSKTVKFCGVGVLPNEASYKLKVVSHGKLNFFSLMTCHEEDTSENPDRGIFKRNGEVKINYKPTLERGMACPLYVSAYNKKQRHAWGILAFEHPRYQLQALLQCNGFAYMANGVSICQSREGLIQEITFSEPVKRVRPVEGAGDRKKPCPELTLKNGSTDTTFLFEIPGRECIYGFIGLDSGKIHQMYTVGYEDIIVRD